jgi:hypothetical protein
MGPTPTGTQAAASTTLLMKKKRKISLRKVCSLGLIWLAESTAGWFF